MRSVQVILLLILWGISSNAQELNVGIMGSPVITMPILDGKDANHPGVKVQNLNINATGGLVLNLQFDKFLIETGGTVASRTSVYKIGIDNYNYNNLGGSTSIAANSEARAVGYSWTVPVMLGYRLSHHEAKTTYDVFGLLGAAYEQYMFSGYTYTSASVSTGSNANSTVLLTNVYPEEPYTMGWVNVSAGFKIRAILLKVGLVEYGLRYHYPLQNAGRFNTNTVVSNGTYGSVFEGDFYPRLSYFDFHFTYYFLNLQGGIKRYRY